MKADDPEGPERNPEADAERVLDLAQRRGLITDDQAHSTLAEVRGTGRGFEVDCAMVVDAAGGVWQVTLP